MRVLDAAELLSLWERGTPRHALDRAALLAAAARPDWPADAIADLPLGAIGASLLRLRAANFGPHIDAHADCRHCGQRLAFALDVAELLRDAPPEEADGRPMPVAEAAGLRIRAPSLRDLAAVAGLAPADAADALLARCTLAGQPDAIDAAAHAQVDEALEALDPQADLAFALTCVGCGLQDMAQLDTAALLWDEISARAGALLQEVHRLASSYGWSEEQILALPATRRAHYLALVEGES
ncbi:hypothetical protein [Alicycliphilus denitrificans]|uniref:Uncharacterized protein n=1 Tax=Alicycliphilus denitrificans TaxID=179636 RepID=A0A3R7HQM9_9BURK|nr:hypothetical protein [Alicycliphilus denitrificans]RKJ98705.1 hypothetical protein CE154_002780 [Alicycliphilus denitrificans]